MEPQGKAGVHNAVIYPIDFATLEKGGWVEARQIENYSGKDGEPVFVSRDDRRYSFRLLQVKARIEKETGIRCRADGDRLRLMTDSEALCYAREERGRHVRGIATQARWLQELDTRALNDTERKIADHEQRHTANIAVIARSEERKATRITRLIESGKDAPQLESGEKG